MGFVYILYFYLSRYYQVCASLTRAKNHTDKIYIFDAEHEKRRKEQLKKLFTRTQEQVEEEQTLLTELRKIEQRKRERDRKTQDLQKLITAADHQADPRKSERKASKKNSNSSRNRPNKSDVSHVSLIFASVFHYIYGVSHVKSTRLNLFFH